MIRPQSPLLQRRQMPRLVPRIEINHIEENNSSNGYNCFRHRCHLRRLIRQCGHMLYKPYDTCTVPIGTLIKKSCLNTSFMSSCLIQCVGTNICDIVFCLYHSTAALLECELSIFVCSHFRLPTLKEICKVDRQLIQCFRLFSNRANDGQKEGHQE